MILTNIDKIPKGQTLPLNAATIEHVVSRLFPYRWVKKKTERRRKVLACYQCNHSRSVSETLGMSRNEILRRSKGHSLSPIGNPTIETPLNTVEEVKEKLGLT